MSDFNPSKRTLRPIPPKIYSKEIFVKIRVLRA